MDIWNEILLRLRELEMIEWLTFGVNALVFLFSKKIASSYGEVKDAEKMNARLRILHGFDLVVFSHIFSALICLCFFRNQIPRAARFFSACPLPNAGGSLHAPPTWVRPLSGTCWR